MILNYLVEYILQTLKFYLALWRLGTRGLDSLHRGKDHPVTGEGLLLYNCSHTIRAFWLISVYHSSSTNVFFIFSWCNYRYQYPYGEMKHTAATRPGCLRCRRRSHACSALGWAGHSWRHKLGQRWRFNAHGDSIHTLVHAAMLQRVRNISLTILIDNYWWNEILIAYLVFGVWIFKWQPCCTPPVGSRKVVPTCGFQTFFPTPPNLDISLGSVV